ncbi:MAG TPA: serine/threonine-protein kinase [Polyangiaceae bacterium]|nr:serine/threonine-protein kinase [Polyangiaceae bacterium]
MPLVDDPLAGQPYRAIRLLGTGGMAEVFLAEHRRFATPCVVKIQHARLARDPTVADRFRLEAEALAHLNHANVVTIFGSGQTLDERPYIVMEYLRGQTMADEFAARGQLPPLEALSYICQLLRGLAAAHQVGIVHRDIKPDNLFLCDGPRGNRLLKVLDFGVARALPNAQAAGPNPLAVPTAAGTVVGALRYVSPEGALGQRVDHRADIYSAALVLYFALAGRGPFDHIQSSLLLLSAHVAEEPEPPSRYCRTPLPPELDRALLRALRKAPSERFQSADELREELERIMTQLRGSPDASEVRALPEVSPRSPDSSGARIRSAPVQAESRAPARSGPLEVGARFLDKYKIVEQIGRGGQAWVYHGEHIFTAREVAIKVVHSPHGMTRETLERGRSEARALGKLDHPNIVVMHDAGITDDGLFYIVMELLRGRSLRSALAAHGRFGIEEVLNLSVSVAEALQAAHELGLIHRDLTPDNVYLTRNNRVKVLDFGIAKMLNEIGFSTHKDVVIGSVLYMSPEQVQGLPLDARSDICALGLMMFEMLLGKHPSLLLFERDLRERHQPSRRAALADIPPFQAHRVAPLLSELDPSIPLDLARVVYRALAKDPDARFHTMRDFISAIRACQESFSGEGPITLRRVAERDLSQQLAGESEQGPESQRQTPRRGLMWDGAGTLTPLPELAELLEGTTSVSEALREDDDDSRFVHRRARLRNTVIASCALAIALFGFGLLRHFEAARGTESQALVRQMPVIDQGSVVAALSPALPLTKVESESTQVSPPEPQPVATEAPARVVPAPVPLPHRPVPVARGGRSAAPALAATPAASNKPADSFSDLSRALEIQLGSEQTTEPAASQPRKRLNGGKLIYGD